MTYRGDLHERILGEAPNSQPQTMGAEIPQWPELKVCIIGAGISGLYVAMLLDFLAIQGLTYDILESSGRVGGRIYTHHFSKERHQYCDVGAMRYPRIPLMKPLFDLFDRVGINDRLIKYYHGFPDGVRNTPEYYNDTLHISNTDVQVDKDSKGSLESIEEIDTFKISRANGGVVPSDSVRLGAAGIVEQIYRPYKKELDENFFKGWKRLMKEDQFSAREIFRRDSPHGDVETIQWLDTMMCASNTLDQGFTDNLMDNYISSVPDMVSNHAHRWAAIEGGSEVIIKAMQKMLNAVPQLQKRVTAIGFDKVESSSNLGMVVNVDGEDAPRRYSTVFNTTALACAQRMDLRGAELTSAQKEAIRALKYDTSCKIAIQFKTNWWQKGGVVGGEAGTDLPIRCCVYPSHNIHDDLDHPAVLLVSYTWSQDAQRIGSLIGCNEKGKSDELLELCVKNLALLHSNIITEDRIREQVMEYYAYDWGADPNVSGGVAMFAPGQFHRLVPHLTQPCGNGNLHFVGEGTSTAHAWVVGALNSAWRGVYQFLQNYERQGGPLRMEWLAKIDALVAEFGKPDEIDVVCEMEDR